MGEQLARAIADNPLQTLSDKRFAANRWYSVYLNAVREPYVLDALESMSLEPLLLRRSVLELPLTKSARADVRSTLSGALALRLVAHSEEFPFAQRFDRGADASVTRLRSEAEEQLERPAREVFSDLEIPYQVLD